MLLQGEEEDWWTGEGRGPMLSTAVPHIDVCDYDTIPWHYTMTIYYATMP
jgi:hypothetical protein